MNQLETQVSEHLRLADGNFTGIQPFGWDPDAVARTCTGETTHA